jgi:hypothetical protein
MKIHPNDFEDILLDIKKQRWDHRNEFVTFLDNTAIGREDLVGFPSAYEAQEFCYENSTDYDQYSYLSTRSVYRAMSEALQNKSLMVESNGLIDIGAMVSAYYIRLEQLPIINNNIMNEKNFDYLKDQVKFTGFGESLENALKENLQKQQPEFSLEHKHEFGKDQTSAVLHFKRSDTTDNYFFNGYDISLKKEGIDEAIKQNFYIGKENNFTFKEAYNLLSGRAVNKDLVNRESQSYNAWVQLNFKETEESGNFKKQYFNERYGYNLEDALSKYPIKELSNNVDKEKLIESLQKGNRQTVTFIVDGNEQKRFIEASPKFKSINVYDSNNQRIKQSAKEGQSESEGQGKKQSAKENQSQDSGDDGKPARKNNRKKKQGIS